MIKKELVLILLADFINLLSLYIRKLVVTSAYCGRSFINFAVIVLRNYTHYKLTRVSLNLTQLSSVLDSKLKKILF